MIFKDPIIFSKGKPIGRIAAFVDFDKANVFDQPTGTIGFFECVNDKESAAILFDTAKDFHGSSSGYGILSDQVPNLTDKYQYVYNATDTVNTRYQPYIVKEYDIYGAPEYASIGTISNAYNSDTS